jgi:hypothetical protein
MCQAARVTSDGAGGRALAAGRSARSIGRFAPSLDGGGDGGGPSDLTSTTGVL